MGKQTVIIQGEVNNEPKYSHNTSKGVCNYTILTFHNYTDNNGKELKKREYHNITTFGKQAEMDSVNIKKGDQVLVIGKLKSGSYTDKKSGRKVYNTYIAPDTVTYCNAGQDELQYVKETTQDTINTNYGW